MRRKALLSVILIAVMILGSVSPAFAKGQTPSNEVTAITKSSVPDSKNEVVNEADSTENSEQESVDVQKADEEKVGTETESDVVCIVEETPDEDSKALEAENLPNDSKTKDVEEDEKKPETLVGAEGERKSVGENVTAEFDSQTGALTFYSQGGTLSSGWKDELGWGNVEAIKTITISDDSDVVYLPEDSSSLFNCRSTNLQSVDLSKADTSNVTNMSGMFRYCTSILTLDVSGFDTSNVTNMSGMFEGCGLQALDVSGFDTSNVTDM